MTDESRSHPVEGLIREIRYRYRTVPSLPVLRLCDEAERLQADAETLREAYINLSSVERERDELRRRLEWSEAEFQSAVAHRRRVETERDNLTWQLRDIRRQFEEQRALGNWPLSDVIARADSANVEVARLREVLRDESARLSAAMVLPSGKLAVWWREQLGVASRRLRAALQMRYIYMPTEEGGNLTCPSCGAVIAWKGERPVDCLKCSALFTTPQPGGGA